MSTQVTKKNSAGVSSGEGLPEEKLSYDSVLPALRGEKAFAHLPEHHLSLFLARRTKVIHFVRHAEGIHNEANSAYGDDTPCTFSTDGSWAYMDATLTDKGISQCLEARRKLILENVRPQVVIVSPFTRTLQTAHIMFNSQNVPFIVHDVCRERWGKYTCDKRRTRSEIVSDIAPIFEATHDVINFDSFAFEDDDDVKWTEEREPSAHVTGRGVELLKWLATRPETEIAVVTHSSFLRHLFKEFGGGLHDVDRDVLHRRSGNCEVRSVTLALHRGFYPVGEWKGEAFTPQHPSFRRGKWATAPNVVRNGHAALRVLPAQLRSHI